ncbi:MAG: aldo/keto reductase [Longimicrobiales bacterium]|nr:aldo/keto reductase [Longimicrobiales bacterium]
MITRRDWLRLSASASAALALQPRMLAALQNGAVATKAIPSSGEQIPVIGLGGRWISNRSSADELTDHRQVLHELARGAAGDAKCCFDSAAGYGGGGSESYAGEWAAEDGFGDDIFWATKVNVAGRGGGSVDRADVQAQIERSFERMKRDVIDLDQVHNMGDPPTQLGVAQEYKDEGRIRYIGITTTSKGQYDHLERVMRDDRYSLDFIGIDCLT